MIRWQWLLHGWLIALLLMLGLPTANVLAQDPPDRADTVAFITEPTSDSVISGSVIIRGAAAHPSAFDSYSLEYANLANPTPVWLPITPDVRQQAADEQILGIWETVNTGIADGFYQIRLTVRLTDETVEPVTIVVSNLQLINTAPTPLPTVPPADNADFGDPTNVPPIEQPPTTTPQPTTETLPDTNTTFNSTVANDSGGSSLNFGRLQSAFCTGAFVTFILFGIFNCLFECTGSFASGYTPDYVANSQ